MNPTQEQVDALVERIKKLVEKHGGQSEVLAGVRKFYALLHARVEGGAYTFLKMEIEKVEALP